MPTWSDGEGGGPVHAALARLLGDGSRTEALFFACAGNTADRHWSGPFTDAGDGRHAWAEGRTDNLLVPWGSERVSVELCAADALDLELSVLDATDDEEAGRAAVRPGDYRCAVVRFVPRPGHEYRVRVRATGKRTGPFHLFVLGGNLHCSRLHGSIPFPGDGAEVVTVGAVDADGGRAFYSSCGPNSPRPKPDLVATVPFASLVRERPFAGTSAATPQAAGLAALVWSARPGWTGKEVRELLTESARDLGVKGHDWETGHGHIALPPFGECRRPKHQ
jgi:subtilisin family serine protease